MIDYGIKGYKIAIFAVVLALLAFSISGTPGIPGTNGTNGVSSDVVVYYLHQGGVMNLTTNFTSGLSSITITPINGFNLIGNWTTDNINSTLIPSGEHTLHYHAFKTSTGGNHIDNVVFECFLLYNNGTVKQNHGFSEQHALTTAIENEDDLDLPMSNISINSTDKWRISVYINQTGTGSNPGIRFDFDDQTDAAFRLPRLVEDNDTAYINKSGDNWTGIMFGHFSNTTNSIDIAGGSIHLTSSNQSTGLSSIVHIEPSNLYIQVTNGGNNAINMSENITTFQKDINMSNKNITNCANCISKNNTISGYVYGNASIRSGAGFTVSHPSTGHYTILYNNSYSSLPYVSLTSFGQLASAHMGVSFDTDQTKYNLTGFSIFYTDGASTNYFDGAFTFVAMP